MTFKELCEVLEETVNFGKFRNVKIKEIIFERPDYADYLEQHQEQVKRILEAKRSLTAMKGLKF